MTNLSKSSRVWISDKSGRKMFNTICGEAYAHSEVKNLKRHLDNARRYPSQYKFLDVATAQVFENGEPVVDMSTDELLAELGA